MAERPVECSSCKKPVEVVYKELVGPSLSCVEMCKDCPVLQNKLQGGLTPPGKERPFPDQETQLYCNNCHTSLEAVKMGNPLGCPECYAVFSDLLVTELLSANKLPSQLKKSLSSKKGQAIHVGKSPDSEGTVPASSRLTALNEALNDALKIENYEQAAWIRDQIKALTEKADERKK